MAGFGDEKVDEGFVKEYIDRLSKEEKNYAYLYLMHNFEGDTTSEDYLLDHLQYWEKMESQDDVKKEAIQEIEATAGFLSESPFLREEQIDDFLQTNSSVIVSFVFFTSFPCRFIGLLCYKFHSLVASVAHIYEVFGISRKNIIFSYRQDNDTQFSESEWNRFLQLPNVVFLDSEYGFTISQKHTIAFRFSIEANLVFMRKIQLEIQRAVELFMLNAIYTAKQLLLKKDGLRAEIAEIEERLYGTNYF
tara:strand:- start:45 stop:788 length:744 start_codon:yes stop_codon:yes gene_type:complete